MPTGIPGYINHLGFISSFPICGSLAFLRIKGLVWFFFFSGLNDGSCPCLDYLVTRFSVPICFVRICRCYDVRFLLKELNFGSNNLSRIGGILIEAVRLIIVPKHFGKICKSDIATRPISSSAYYSFFTTTIFVSVVVLISLHFLVKTVVSHSFVNQ